MGKAPGKVYLVGAGPGDPGLLTLRGRECLERAEVVIYDALVNPVLLDFARQAEVIFAGKKTDRHSLPQEEMNAILIEQARKFSVVVRLKGGDPFVFGRGGEEALALKAQGIPFEVVPGITAGLAGPAYAGIPVTHRGVTSSLTFFTGHGVAGETSGTLDFSRPILEGTLVFYMGVRNLGLIADELVRFGRAAETPVAVIEWGTYARQRTVTGTLEDINGRCAEARVETPALVVVGEVVALRANLEWFETRPLYGLHVVVTHAAQTQGRLERLLRDLGADVLAFPTIEIEHIETVQADSGEDTWKLEAFDWVVLTSVNGAEMFFDGLERRGLDARALAATRLCASGATTVESVRRRFLRVDAVPEGYDAAAIVAALEAHGPLRGTRLLLPRSDIARKSLPEALRAAGAEVTELMAYRTKAPVDVSNSVARLFAFRPRLVVFTNSVALRNFAEIFTLKQLVEAGVVFASIGPVTSAAARAHGIEIDIEPVRHEIPHLIEAICAWRADARP